MPEGQAEDQSSPGRVFWITGLSGAGKTTLGRELSNRLRAAGHAVIFLDGDALRLTIAEDLGYTVGDRRRSAMRNARLCRLLADQGNDVVCATISLFHEVQRWNRENIPGYREIYLRVPIDELRRRDRKGIYAAAQAAGYARWLVFKYPRRLPRRRTWSSTITERSTSRRAVDRILAVCDNRHGAWHREAEAAGRFQNEGRISGSAGAVTAEWPRPATGPIFGWRLALGRRQQCSLPLPRRRGVQIRLSCGAARAARTAMHENSQAGRYDSVLGVAGSAAIAQAIDRVIESFAGDGSDDDQIFVQPMLDRVAMAGVAFSRSPIGGPYFVINYDDRSGLTRSRNRRGWR